MKKILLILVAASVLLSGCAAMRANSAGYEARLQALKGTHIDQVVLAWGPPDAEYTFEDGRRMYAFVTSKTYLTPRIQPTLMMNRFYGGYGDDEMEMKHLYCETRLITDKEGKIAEWTFKGNACKAVPPELEAQAD